MEKTLKISLLILIICSINACSSWDWEPEFYVPVFEEQYLINSNGDIVFFDEPRIETFSCLSDEQVALLAAEIEKIKNQKKRRKARNFLKKLIQKREKLRVREWLNFY